MLRHSVPLISLALSACVSTAAPDSATRPSVHSAVEVEALIERADSLYSAGRFAEVIPLYERAVELNPEELEAYVPLGRSYAKLGLFETAERWFWERRRLSDEAARAHCHLADVALRKRDREALTLHTDSLVAFMGENPSFAMAYCAAEMLAYLGDYQGAKRLAEAEVFELRHEGVPLMGLAGLAFYAQKTGESERAGALLREYERVQGRKIRQGEDLAGAHFTLAEISAIRGNAGAAVSHLREALQSGGWGEYWGGYYYLRAAPIFENLHGHPEYELLMAELQADTERMRSRVVQEQGDAQGVVERLDSIARVALADGLVAGFSVAVLRGNDTLLLKGYGQADVGLGVTATSETKYRLVGPAQTMQAALLMQQAEQGHVSLDEGISPLLPDFPWQGRRVTLRQLMDATSGLPDYHYLGDPHWAQVAVPKSYAEVTALFAGRPFTHEPGEEQPWTISGFHLAGILLEQLAGRSFGELIEEDVAHPLGLEHTTYCDEREIVPDLATGYMAAGDSLLQGSPMSPSMYPFTLRVCASAGDVATFYQALREGRLIDRESYKQMITLSAAGLEALEREGEGLAVGFTIGELEGHRTTSNFGALEIGYASAAIDVPEENLTVVVLTNTPSAAMGSLAGTLTRVALGLPLAAEEPGESAPRLRDLPISTTEMDRYAGTYQTQLVNVPAPYRSYQRTYRIYDESGRLMLQPIGEVPERLLRQGEHTFARASDPERRIVLTLEDGRASEIEIRAGDRVRERGARTGGAVGMQPHPARARNQSTDRPTGSVVAFTNATVIDGTGASPMENATVVIRGKADRLRWRV